MLLIVTVIKLSGAASQKGWAFQRVRKIGELGNSQLVTIGASLDHCHVPGREAFESVPDDAYVVGMGIHNEPVRYCLPSHSLYAVR
jgi:dihydroxyacetone kinase